MGTIQFKIFRSIDSLKLRRAWNHLYLENGHLMPYQDREYVRNMLSYYRWHFLSRWYQPLFFLFYKTEKQQERPLVIAPVVKMMTHASYMILGGNVRGCGSTDFIYGSSVTLQEMEECLYLLLSHCHWLFSFKRLLTSSPVYQALRSCYADVEEKDTVCVNIPLPDDYEAYLMSLSTNTRQNVRKAYHRLERAGLSYLFDFFHPSSQNPHYDECLEIYIKRLTEILHKRSGMARRAEDWKVRHMRHDTRTLRDFSNACTAVLRIGGDVAAVLFGLVNVQGDRILIPRIAFNSSFKFYSPGLLLISELAKHLMAGSKICNIDLTRGAERYKFDMGGQTYLTKDLRIDRPFATTEEI